MGLTNELLEAVRQISEAVGSESISLEELVDDVRRLQNTQSTFLREATKRWRQRVKTAYQFGWFAGKEAARGVVAPENPELANVIAWVPYSDRPEETYADLQTLIGTETPDGSRHAEGSTSGE